MKVGFFGGSFDPPHLSHVAVCAFALSVTDLEKVLVVPCFRHALSKELTDFEHRLAMCRRAMSGLRGVEVTDVERVIGGTSFTLNTLQHLQREHDDWELSLIVGADAFAERRSWYRFDDIRRLAGIIVFDRGGAPGDAGERLPAPPSISSTAIRAQLRMGEEPRGLVPVEVLRYIFDHELYR